MILLAEFNFEPRNSDSLVISFKWSFASFPTELLATSIKKQHSQHHLKKQYHIQDIQNELFSTEINDFRKVTFEQSTNNINSLSNNIGGLSKFFNETSLEYTEKSLLNILN